MPLPINPTALGLHNPMYENNVMSTLRREEIARTRIQARYMINACWQEYAVTVAICAMASRGGFHKVGSTLELPSLSMLLGLIMLLVSILDSSEPA